MASRSGPAGTAWRGAPEAVVKGCDVDVGWGPLLSVSTTNPVTNRAAMIPNTTSAGRVLGPGRGPRRRDAPGGSMSPCPLVAAREVSVVEAVGLPEGGGSSDMRMGGAGTEEVAGSSVCDGQARDRRGRHGVEPSVQGACPSR